MLAPQQRKVIEMRYWDNMSIMEIATNLGFKRQSVASIHDQALAKLKKMLVTGKVTQMIRFSDQAVRTTY